MSQVTEIRLLFLLGVVTLAAGALIAVVVTRWLTARIACGREWLAASRLRERPLEHEPRRMQRLLEARSARWRMLL